MNEQAPQIHTVSLNDQEFQELISVCDRAVQAGRLEAALRSAVTAPSPELLVASRLLQKFQHEPVATPGEKDGGNATDESLPA